MVYIHRINKTKFIVHVHKKGGRTDVYKGKELYFSGQYFPDRKELWCPKFKFETVRQIIEDSINNRINPGDVIFPYYAGPDGYKFQEPPRN